jgi:endonuclease/exonuclease/phosphatase family metal-dependent hydrolase
MSYNVGGQRGDVAAMAELVRSQRPDVVAVQEAPRRLRWRSRCADLARRFGLVYAAGGLPGLGNLILVDLRVRVHDTWCLRYPLTPGRHLRGAALARCSVGGSTFVVAGTHLATDPTERPGQAAILAKALAEVSPPLVLAGDFNEEAGGAAWTAVADGRIDAAGDSGPATYPATAPAQRLDAIFVDRRFEVSDCRVLDTAEARRASDHLPVVVDLTLP